MSTPSIISLFVAAAAGFIFLTYESFARQRAWPIGELFTNNIIEVIGTISLIGALVLAYFYLSFVWVIAIFVSAWVLAFILSLLLKSWVQFTSLVLLILSWVALILFLVTG